MNHPRLWVAATIIALIVFIGFALSVPHTRDVIEPQSSPVVVQVPPVTLHDAFKKGIHSITGSIAAPNACTTVSAASSITGDASTTKGIIVAISMLAGDGICLQLSTPTTFQTTISAPANLPITVTVNGATATTSVP